MEIDRASIRRVLLTGSPGAGKTTLLHEFQRHGYAAVPDSARAIIRHRNRAGLAPRPGPAEFAREILKADIRQYEGAVPEKSDLVFFDRGIPDALGMLAETSGLSGLERDYYLTAYPYHRQAFILPPWEAIYRQDAERDQDFAEAVQVNRRVRQWYARCGFQLVEVPEGPAAARCKFVLRRLGEVGEHS